MDDYEIKARSSPKYDKLVLLLMMRWPARFLFSSIFTHSVRRCSLLTVKRSETSAHCEESYSASLPKRANWERIALDISPHKRTAVLISLSLSLICWPWHWNSLIGSSVGWCTKSGRINSIHLIDLENDNRLISSLSYSRFRRRWSEKETAERTFRGTFFS